MIDPTTFLGYFIAMLALGGLLRLWWSTRNVERIRLKKECDRALKLCSQLNNEVDAMRENKRLLEADVRTLRETIKVQDQIIAKQVNAIKKLEKEKAKIDRANDELNAMVGAQSELNEKLEKDVDMLKDQVLDLRAKLGMEPMPEQREEE